MGDGLPELICLECLNRLQNAFEFRKQCKISDKTLNELKDSVKFKDNKSLKKETDIDLKSENSYSNADLVLNNFNDDSEDEPLINRIEQKISPNLNNNKINIYNLERDMNELKSNCEIVKNKTKKQLKMNKKAKLKRKGINAIQEGLPCPKCKRSYELESDLEIHMITHQVFKELNCPKCLKSFENINNLKRHLNIHLTNKPYKCKVCNKRFAAPGGRNRHLRVHTGTLVEFSLYIPIRYH